MADTDLPIAGHHDVVPEMASPSASTVPEDPDTCILTLGMQRALSCKKTAYAPYTSLKRFRNQDEQACEEAYEKAFRVEYGDDCKEEFEEEYKEESEPDIFKPFPRLPPELQIKIWEMGVDVMPGQIITVVSLKNGYSTQHEPVVLLSVCITARKTALWFYRLCFEMQFINPIYMNPARDALGISSNVDLHFFLETAKCICAFNKIGTTLKIESIEHLGLRYHKIDQASRQGTPFADWLRSIIARFRSLRTLYLGTLPRQEGAEVMLTELNYTEDITYYRGRELGSRKFNKMQQRQDEEVAWRMPDQIYLFMVRGSLEEKRDPYSCVRGTASM